MYSGLNQAQTFTIDMAKDVFVYLCSTCTHTGAIARMCTSRHILQLTNSCKKYSN